MAGSERVGSGGSEGRGSWLGHMPFVHHLERKLAGGSATHGVKRLVSGSDMVVVYKVVVTNAVDSFIGSGCWVR